MAIKTIKHKRSVLILWISLLSLTATTVYCQQSNTTTTTSSDSAASATAAAAATSKKAIASCGLNGNTDTICSPKVGDTWKNGTWYPITWNPLYPSYVSSSMLDIYIYFVQNYQNVLIKTLTDINTSKGSVPVLVDDTWRLDPTAQTYDSLVYIVPSGVNPDKEINNRYSDYPPPVHNLVAQAAVIPPLTTALPSNISSTIASSTTTVAVAPTNQIPITPPPQQSPSSPLSNLSGNTNNKQQQELQQHIIQPGIIAAVVLACLAILGACLAVFWVMRHSRRKLVYGEKGHLELNSTASSSMFPMNNVDGSSREKLHHHNSSSVSIANPSAIHNYSNFSSDAVVMSSPLLTAENGITRLHGTAHTGSERGSLKSHTAPTTPINATNNNKQFGFMSVPSLPLPDDNGGVYMLGASDSNRPNSTTSFSNISSRSEPPLTSTDALLIADTFRQRMRRPDWPMQKSPEEKEQEYKRRQLSEELLKKELEAEGTLMKKVGKRAHLLAATYQQQQDSSS